MLVFDDVVVFVQKQSNNNYIFYSRDKQAAFALEHLIVRERADGDQTGIYLIVRPPGKTELYEIRVDKNKEV
jgi:hypothetical protein